MKLENLITAKSSVVLKRWFDLVLETYPPDTAGYLRSRKDRFANPVGQTIYVGLEGLLKQLLEDADRDGISPFLDNVIRVRAIQDFTPSQAVSFIFDLKKVVREELGKEISKHALFEELSLFESRVDVLAIASFDLYMKCREKVFEIRANAVKNRTFRLLQRANMICDVQDREPDLADRNNIKVNEKR